MAIRSHYALTRRQWNTLAAAGALGSSASGWFGQLAAEAAAAPTNRQGKSCILLWMDGGPSHVDTFDPKPEASSDVRGELTAIDTNVAGVRICEKLPKMATQLHHAAVLRGMSTDEADHERARIYLHTGYKPGFGGVNYPPLGSIVSSQLGDAHATLPNFVVTGTPLTKHDFLTTAGYLGPEHQAFVHADPDQMVAHLQPSPAVGDFAARAETLNRLEQMSLVDYAPAAAAHRTTFVRAVQLMQSDRCRAFDLSQESAATCEAYGDSRFGRSCLLARRLVEVGVRFVEVYLQNWDTHEKRVADAALEMMPVMDQGMAALISDLSTRGMLDDTLVVWMGEFGRTPRINRNGGRDHYSQAWSTLLAGGGIRGGQVIGRTDSSGARVVDRPISVVEFQASLCKILGIDYERQMNTPAGRPVRLVNTGATPVAELFR